MIHSPFALFRGPAARGKANESIQAPQQRDCVQTGVHPLHGGERTLLRDAEQIPQQIGAEEHNFQPK